MSEEKASYERDSDARRSDLKRHQTSRIQDFDLLTVTSGLELDRVVEGSEPSAVDPAAAAARSSTLTSGARPPSSRGSAPAAPMGISRSELDLSAIHSNTFSSSSSSTPSWLQRFPFKKPSVPKGYAVEVNARSSELDLAPSRSSSAAAVATRSQSSMGNGVATVPLRRPPPNPRGANRPVSSVEPPPPRSSPESTKL